MYLWRTAKCTPAVHYLHGTERRLGQSRGPPSSVSISKVGTLLVWCLKAIVRLRSRRSSRFAYNWVDSDIGRDPLSCMPLITHSSIPQRKREGSYSTSQTRTRYWYSIGRDTWWSILPLLADEEQEGRGLRVPRDANVSKAPSSLNINHRSSFGLSSVSQR